jgi:hypothetical protein
MEDRGIFVDKLRGNLELAEAGFTLNADATFEGLPFYMALFYNGGLSDSGTDTTGHYWSSGPDLFSDTLKTATLEAGDDQVQWQGAYGTVDTADFTMPLDDTLKVALGGFVMDWTPSTLADRPDSPVTTVSTSPTVLDTSITLADVGKAVTGTQMPANAYIANVIPGTSFDIYVAGVPTNATASSTTASVTVKSFMYSGFLQTLDSQRGIYTAFTKNVPDRVVESASGWQSRMYMDTLASGNPIGTTWLRGRFRSANWGYHNQNRRKYFGDGSSFFTRLGRGRRQTHCQIVYEALDTQQYAQYYGNTVVPYVASSLPEQLIRIGLYGLEIPTSNLGTCTGISASSTPVSSIPVSPTTTVAIRGGQGIRVGGVTFVTMPTTLSSGASAIPVQAQVVQTAIPAGSRVYAAKTMNFDFWGVWDTFVLGQQDTNTTFQIDLQAVYDVVAGKESNISVANGNTAL